MHNKKGISLVVLIVTVVILIILTSVIFRVVQNNNFTETVDELEFKNEISQYSQEIKNAIIDEYANDKQIFEKVIDEKEEIAKYCPVILQSKYISCMYIKNGELTLRKNMLTQEERKWSIEIGIPIE